MIRTHALAPVLRTSRLVLRGWRDDDVAVLAGLNANPRVVEFLAGPLTGTQTERMVERFDDHFVSHGYGLWSVEVPGVADCIGFIGLDNVRADLPFAPGVEIGWRLAAAHWGRGYATEGARAAADFAFGSAGLGELVSMTAVGNLRSRAVMERLGMSRDPADDFEHPRLAVGHRLRPHVLYRLTAPPD